jgi:nitrogen regulatory protein PII-like uncharacterized protein
MKQEVNIMKNFLKQLFSEENLDRAMMMLLSLKTNFTVYDYRNLATSMSDEFEDEMQIEKIA